MFIGHGGHVVGQPISIWVFYIVFNQVICIAVELWEFFLVRSELPFVWLVSFPCGMNFSLDKFSGLKC